jgi:hypothetical protein
MATISRNFRAAVVEAKGTTIRVGGTTIKTENDGSTRPFNETPDTEMFITIMVPPSAPPRVALADLSLGDTWNAHFDGPAPAQPENPSGQPVQVRMIGLALTADPPYVWEATMPLEHR